LSAVAHDALAAGSKRWQGFTVKRIFSSSFYAGQRIYGKRTRKPRPLVSGTVPAIVTKERQRQAQLRLAEQRARHARGQPTTTCSRARSAAPHAATPRAAPSTTPSITAPLAGTPAPGSGRPTNAALPADNPSVRADIIEPDSRSSPSSARERNRALARPLPQSRRRPAGITVDDVDRPVADVRTELNKVERNIARLAEWTRR
jgi:hypothetical protein